MTRLPQVADEVIVADFDTELVVLVPTRRRAYHLDTARALLLDSCVNRDHRESLTAELVDATGEDTNTLRKWVAGVIAELQGTGILVDDSQPGMTSRSGDDFAIFTAGDHHGPDGRNP